MMKHLAWLLGLGVAAGAWRVQAAPVDILFESFESPAVSGIVEINPTGWKRVHAAQNYSGLWNVDSGKITTPYGSQVARAWTQGGFQSTNLTQVVQPGTTYTLTFNVGNCESGSGNPRSDNQYTAEILAGENVLATVSGLTNTDDMSQSNSTSVAIGASHPYLGMTLGVRLRMTGGHWTAQTLFDNVRLVADESDEWKRSLFYGK